MKQKDKQRLRQLKKQLRTNPIDSVRDSIELEIKQIKLRDIPVITNCINCNTQIDNTGKVGGIRRICPVCETGKKSKPRARLTKCPSCNNGFKNTDMVPHEGKLVCGDCMRKHYDKIDKHDDNINILLENSTFIGNGIDQAQTYAQFNPVERRDALANRRYTKRAYNSKNR